MFGNLNLSGQRTFDVPEISTVSEELLVHSAISGAGGLTKTGLGVLRLTGTASSTYAGPTRAFGGRLVLNRVGGTATAVPAALEVGDGAAPAGQPDIVRLTTADQIADSATVSVKSLGEFDLNNLDETIGGLQDNGTVRLGEAGDFSTLTVGSGNASSTFDGIVLGFGTLAKTGTGTLTLNGAIDNSNLTLQLNLGGGQVVLGNTMRVASVSIGLNTKVTLSATASPGGRVLVTKALAVNIVAGRLDLTNGGLVVDYPVAGPSVLADVRTSITSGFAANAWNGPGILSSTAAAQADKSVGYAENNPAAGGFGKTKFLGQDVDATSVLVRFTFDGDADLDGAVGPGDFNLLASNFGQTQRDWAKGDFDYDRTVGPGDFNLLASRFGSALPPTVRARGKPERAAEFTLAERSAPAPRRQTHAHDGSSIV
jgi:autotransporter-associated beta strand protein